MRDDRPVITLYHETEHRSQNGEEVLEVKTGSKQKESEGQEADRSVKDDTTEKGDANQSELKEKDMLADVNSEKTDGARKSDEQKNSDESLAAGSGEEPPEVSAASNVEPPASDDPPDVSDMLKFSLQSPGGACVVSLSLMSLGLLNVYMSIPKQMVVVDSTLVDKDVVKR